MPTHAGRSDMAKRNDPKETLSALEKKLLECNLFENGKASVFAKPHSQRSLQQKCTAFPNFTPVQHGQTLSRFPPWCQAAYVPAYYHNIEKLVSGPGGIDGPRVSAFLLSSGLPTPVLGKIWELCSCTVPGSFTQQELYAALALVAVVQAGYPAALEVLFQLPQPPLPAFVQQQQRPANSINRPLPQSVTPQDSTVWRQYPVPPNVHPPAGLKCEPQHSVPASVSTLQQGSVGRSIYTTAASNVRSSLSLLDRTPTTVTVPAPELRQTQSVTESARPAVWCSEVRRPDSVSHTPLVRPEVRSAVLVPSVLNQGETAAAIKVDGFDDLADDFDDFMSASAVPADSVEDRRKREGLGTDSRQEAGDCGRSALDVVEENVVTSAGDSVVVGFKGLGSSSAESNPTAVTNSVEMKCPSSKKKKSSLPKAVRRTSKNSENVKPFQFKIDISALMSLKPEPSKRIDSQRGATKTTDDFALLCDLPGETTVQPAQDDDFADFQQAFPDTKVATVASSSASAEDRYGALKKLPEQAMIRWDAPAKQDSDDGTWFTGLSNDPLKLSEAPSPAPQPDEDFGDFCHVTAPSLPTVQSAPVPSTEEPRFLETSSHTSEQLRKNQTSQDTLSLGDRLSVYSLELSGQNGSSPSHHGSVLSLELRIGNSDGTDDDESPRPGSDDGGGVSASADETASGDIPSDTQEEAAAPQMGQPALLLDKYSVIREVSQQPAEEGDCADKWVCCLRSVLEVMTTAGSFFGRESSSQICREALGTEEGANYVKNVTEVYKVCRRIELSSKLTGKRTEALEKLCSQIHALWEDLASFLENSCLFSVPKLPGGDAKWLPDSADSSKSCGICLLHVDNPEMMVSKLSYGAREYHAPCANLWVNCVGSLLPSVPYPDLL